VQKAKVAIFSIATPIHPSMKKINLIGGGRVGSTLARLWQDQGTFEVQDVLTRGLASAQHAVDFIGAGRATGSLAEMRPADLWMLAVPDREISAVASALAQANSASMAFHCSGALSSAEMAGLEQLGWKVASAHCLLSFANPSDALEQFPDTPCALEGDAQAIDVLSAAFREIQGNCFTVLKQNKLLYHAAAVFATNFLPVIQSTADQLWRDSGMPDALAEQVRAKLLQNAVANILSLGPAGALTGPAARGDVALVKRQAEAVMEWDPQAGDAYKALSQLASKLATLKLPQPGFEQGQDNSEQNLRYL
jgi:predicted short-subunit dehydrogenase-like oxidoreductase (DUF2520 family)